MGLHSLPLAGSRPAGPVIEDGALSDTLGLPPIASFEPEEWANSWSVSGSAADNDLLIAGPNGDVPLPSAMETVPFGEHALFHPGGVGFERATATVDSGLSDYFSVPGGLRWYFWTPSPSSIDITLYYAMNPNYDGEKFSVRHWARNDQCYSSQWTNGSPDHSGRARDGSGSFQPTASTWHEVMSLYEVKSGTKQWDLPYGDSRLVCREVDLTTQSYGETIADFQYTDTTWNESRWYDSLANREGDYQLTFADSDPDVYFGGIQRVLP